MFREDFSERSSALILISIVVLSLMYNFFAGREATRPRRMTELLFPAYETPADNPMAEQINGAMPFRVTAAWPESWEITTDAGDVSWPMGEIFTPYYIYEGETPIGCIGFGVFTPYGEKIDYENGYKQVWPQLRLGSMYVWDPFTPELNGFTSQIGTVAIDYVDYTQLENYDSLAAVPHIRTNGVLAYDMDLCSWVGMAFMPGAVDDVQLKELALSFRMYAM